MEEVTEIPTVITPSHKALLFNIPLDHASITSMPAVRPSLEQTRTCVADLEDLIKLCNENLPILRANQAIFRRTTHVIESARAAISQICQLLEKMAMTTTTRPRSSSSSGFPEPPHIQSHQYPTGNGNDGLGQVGSGSQIQICFKSRWGRLSTEARNLNSLCQQQLVAKEHGAVVNELNFMRQLVLIAPAIVRGAGGLGQDVQATTSHHGGGERHAPKTVWNNMGLLNEMIGGGTQSPLGRAGTNLYQQQPQPRQETHIHPRPELGSSRDYNFVLPPPYPGPEAKQQPVLRPSPSSISVLSSTTLWNASTDPDPAFKELPGAITQPTSTNPPTRPPHATHKPSSSSSATVFDTMGLGLMYSDYGFGPSPGFGLSHDQKPSSSTSTPAKSAELPGFREPGELPATTTTRNTNTLIYNHHQHTTHSHNHNYQCHHHHYHQHHRHTNNNNPNYRGNQMEGVRIQHQHPQQQQQSAGGGGHHTCNYAWEQQQRNNNIWSGPAINEGQPQELSSVVFAPDPVELP